jgi:hypothetical protein
MSWDLESSIDESYGEASFENFEEEEISSSTSPLNSSRPAALLTQASTNRQGSPLSKEQNVSTTNTKMRSPSIPAEPAQRASSPRNSSFRVSPASSKSSPTVTTATATTATTATTAATDTSTDNINKISMSTAAIPTRTILSQTPSTSSSAPSPGSSKSKKKSRVFFPDDDVVEAEKETSAPTGLPKRKLTMEEFRKSMMESLTKKGIVGSLKAQLRAQMLGSLKEHAIQGGILSSGDKDPLEVSAGRRGTIPLRLRVVDSFFAEYLKNQQLEYTLSIFLTESNLSTYSSLETSDALRLLRVESDTMLHHRLTESRPNGSATIVRLLDHVKRTQGAGRRSSSCQTENTRNTPASERLYERLAELEHGFKQQEQSITSSSGVEERMIQYQKECDERSEKEIENRMIEYQNGKLLDLKRDERSKYLSMVSAVRTNLKKEYQRQVLELKERHKQKLDQAERAQRELDRVAFDQRQRHLDAMNRLTSREEEIRRQAQVEKRATEVERQRIKDMENVLRTKLDEANTAQINRQRIWSEQMDSYKKDVLNTFREREEALRTNERVLEERRTKMELNELSLKERESILQTATSNEARVIECESALAAEARRTSTLALELEQARDHLKVITESSNLDRETLSQRTRECSDARDQVLALRKATEELEREGRRNEIAHEKLVRNLGERLSESQARLDRVQMEHATRLRQATSGADERVEQLERALSTVKAELSRTKSELEDEQRMRAAGDAVAAESLLERNLDVSDSSSANLRAQLEDVTLELESVKQERDDLQELLQKARAALDEQAEGIDMAIDMNNSINKSGVSYDDDLLVGSISNSDGNNNIKSSIQVQQDQEDVLMRAKRANDNLRMLLQSQRATAAMASFPQHMQQMQMMSGGVGAGWPMFWGGGSSGAPQPPQQMQQNLPVPPSQTKFKEDEKAEITKELSEKYNDMLAEQMKKQQIEWDQKLEEKMKEEAKKRREEKERSKQLEIEQKKRTDDMASQLAAALEEVKQAKEIRIVQQQHAETLERERLELQKLAEEKSKRAQQETLRLERLNNEKEAKRLEDERISIQRQQQELKEARESVERALQQEKRKKEENELKQAEKKRNEDLKTALALEKKKKQQNEQKAKEEKDRLERERIAEKREEEEKKVREAEEAVERERREREAKERVENEARIEKERLRREEQERVEREEELELVRQQEEEERQKKIKIEQEAKEAAAAAKLAEEAELRRSKEENDTKINEAREKVRQRQELRKSRERVSLCNFLLRGCF